MSEAPRRIWITWAESIDDDYLRPLFISQVAPLDDQQVAYIRADFFDTLTEILEEKNRKIERLENKLTDAALTMGITLDWMRTDR